MARQTRASVDLKLTQQEIENRSSHLIAVIRIMAGRNFIVEQRDLGGDCRWAVLTGDLCEYLHPEIDKDEHPDLWEAARKEIVKAWGRAAQEGFDLFDKRPRQEVLTDEEDRTVIESTIALDCGHDLHEHPNHGEDEPPALPVDEWAFNPDFPHKNPYNIHSPIGESAERMKVRGREPCSWRISPEILPFCHHCSHDLLITKDRGVACEVSNPEAYDTPCPGCVYTAPVHVAAYLDGLALSGGVDLRAALDLEAERTVADKLIAFWFDTMNTTINRMIAIAYLRAWVYNRKTQGAQEGGASE